MDTPMGEIDGNYFSLLPDALILIIISLLPFKEAVATSILQRRFRHFWLTSTNIHLDYNFFIKNIKDGDSVENAVREFIDFITTWMENYKEPNIHKFSLIFPDPGFARSLMNEIIGFAICRPGIKEIHLDFSEPSWDQEYFMTNAPPSVLSVQLFEACETLESLELFACSFKFQQINTFLALKNVFLGWMELNGALLRKFLLMCPCLVVLILRRCWGFMEIDIKASGLEMLIINKCINPEYVSVNAPKLKYFKYTGISTVIEMEENMRSLEEVVLDFRHYIDFRKGNTNAEIYHNLFNEFWGARTLTVCSYMLQIITTAAEALSLGSRLKNMRHLILKTQLHMNEYYGITFFLNSCPSLEILSLDIEPKNISQKYKPPFKFSEHPFYSNVYSPACVGKSLKEVIVKGYRGLPDEDTVLSFLLKYGTELEHLTVSLADEEGPEGIDMKFIFNNNLVELINKTQIGSSKVCLTLCGI